MRVTAKLLMVGSHAHRPQQGQGESHLPRNSQVTPSMTITLVLVERSGCPIGVYISQAYVADITVSIVTNYREMKLVGDYWTQLASLEHHLHTHNKHQTTLNELVDLVDFTKY